MYKLTLVLLLAPFALFSLVVAIPKPVPDKIDELEKRQSNHHDYIGKGILYYPSVAESLQGMRGVTRCGDNNNTVSDNDSRNPVVAIPRVLFDYDDYCHKYVQIGLDGGEDSGKKFSALIVDLCDACEWSDDGQDIGLSPSLWRQLDERSAYSEAFNPVDVRWYITD